MIAVYGLPPPDLVETPSDAVQTSPLIPGSADLSEMAAGSLDRAVVLAPPGTLERGAVLAQALRALKPGGDIIALAPKDRGGQRLSKELTALGLDVDGSGKRHHRICLAKRPAKLTGIDEAIAAGAPRQIPGLGWTRPGVFSWDRLDPGTAGLIQALPALSGKGADLGCGIGALAQAVLTSPTVADLTLIDIDRRAIDCARRNLTDDRARFEWADARSLALAELDFVVMNPPFHDGGAEDRALGQAFIAAAAKALRKGGECWLVANRHLPYEAALKDHFASTRPVSEGGAFKIYRSVR